MQAMQEELGNVEVEGISGGGLVAVRMTAKMEVKGVQIDPSLMKADDARILEGLLVTAHNDARRKAEAAMQEKDAGADRRPEPAAGSLVYLKWPQAVAGPEIERLIQHARADCGPGSPLGAARGAAPDQEARSADDAAHVALQVAIEKSRSARPAAISTPKTLHRLHRSAPRSARSSSWSPTSPISWALERANATKDAITCWARRCRRSTASARRTSP
jgi:DNA-binding YbaB/EbfC family protein